MSIFILLRCEDIDGTRRFYRDALGFSTSNTAEGTLTASGMDDTLIFTGSDLWNSAPSFSGTIYFTVSNLDGLYSGPKAKIAWGPEVMAYGSREFAVRDCNGYFLAFREGISYGSRPGQVVFKVERLASCHSPITDCEGA